MSNKRDKVVAQVRDAQANVDAATKRVEEKRAEWQEHLNKKAPLTQQIEDLDNDYANIRDRKKRLNDKKDRAREKAKETEDSLAQHNEKLEQCMAKARQFCEQSPYPENHQYRRIPAILK